MIVLDTEFPTDYQMGHYFCVSDNLNTHISASMVRYVAEESDFTDDLGV